MGGVHLKRRYDVIHGIILILFLVIAIFIGNAIIKGILLLLFSGVLIFNTVVKLIQKKDDGFKDKFFYGILLFLDVILALLALFVIVSAILE
jgi:hypothetical protein